MTASSPGFFPLASTPRPETAETKARGVVLYALVAVIAVLSLNPVAYMISPAQLMNTSFDPFDLVNTYGAFGTIGRERYQVVLGGTDAAVPDRDARWTEYLFKCQPVGRLRPSVRDLSLPLPPGTADVVRGNAQLRPRAVARAPRIRAAPG